MVRLIQKKIKSYSSGNLLYTSLISGILILLSVNPSLLTQSLYSLSDISNDETLLFECNSKSCKVSSSLDDFSSSQATQINNDRMINRCSSRFIIAILQISRPKCLETKKPRYMSGIEIIFFRNSIIQ